MKIKRSIYKQLADDLNRSEVSIILGPRQVGKTFLLKEVMKIFMKQYPETAGGIVYSTNLNVDADHLGKRVASEDSNPWFTMTRMPGGEICFAGGRSGTNTASQYPAVPKSVLIEIARKKQERSMATQFKKYRDQQAKAAARQTTTSATRKRTKAEALANQIGSIQNKIGDLDFPSFSTEDREMAAETLNPLKNSVDEALNRAVRRGKILA